MTAVLIVQSIMLGVVCVGLAWALVSSQRSSADFRLKMENRRIVRESTAQMRLPFPANAQMLADLDRGVVPRGRRRATAAPQMSAADLARAGSEASNGMLDGAGPRERRFTTEPPRE